MPSPHQAMTNGYLQQQFNSQYAPTTSASDVSKSVADFNTNMNTASVPNTLNQQTATVPARESQPNNADYSAVTLPGN